MPLILNKRNRFAFLFGRRSGIRSTSEVVDQLQAQLAAAERAKVAGLNREVAALTRDRQDAIGTFQAGRDRCVRHCAESVANGALRADSLDHSLSATMLMSRQNPLALSPEQIEIVIAAANNLPPNWQRRKFLSMVEDGLLWRRVPISNAIIQSVCGNCLRALAVGTGSPQLSQDD